MERDNPIHLPIEEKELLKEEILAFIQVCQTGQPAPTNGDEGGGSDSSGTDDCLSSAFE